MAVSLNLARRSKKQSHSGTPRSVSRDSIGYLQQAHDSAVGILLPHSSRWYPVETRLVRAESAWIGWRCRVRPRLSETHRLSRECVSRRARLDLVGCSSFAGDQHAGAAPRNSHQQRKGLVGGESGLGTHSRQAPRVRVSPNENRIRLQGHGHPHEESASVSSLHARCACTPSRRPVLSGARFPRVDGRQHIAALNGGHGSADATVAHRPVVLWFNPRPVVDASLMRPSAPLAGGNSPVLWIGDSLTRHHCNY